MLLGYDIEDNRTEQSKTKQKRSDQGRAIKLG